MAYHVLWRSRFGSDVATELQERLGGAITLTIETDKDKLASHLPSVDILIDGKPDAFMLDGERLKHVVIPYAGADPDLCEAVEKRPHLTLHNSHFNAAFVAQHAVALMLAATNRIVEADAALRQGDWRPRYDAGFVSKSLMGKTCLLLGYGAIGKELEPRITALGMRVEALRRRPQAGEYGPDQLLEALGVADVIMVSLPATPETEGMLGDTAFAAVKPGAVLVNVGRGAVIDPQALFGALQSERLMAAALDVWWQYPQDKEARAHTYPADVPLHKLPNLVLSPHRANHVDDEMPALLGDIEKTLRALVGGETRNEVDVTRGY